MITKIIKLIATFLLFVFINQSLAQERRVYFNSNNDYNNPEKEKIFQLWKQYLTGKENIDTLWASSDRQKFKGIDIMRNAVGMGGLIYGDWSVIGISKMGENFLIKTAVFVPDKDTLIGDKTTLFLIANTLAVKQNNGYKLSNYINYSTASWYTKPVGKIIYHYPPSYPFNIFKAREASIFLDSIQAWFACDVDTISYYIPENCSEGKKMVGFEYFIGGENELNLCGYYDRKNNIIYSNFIMGELYKHELIHQVNNKYPQAHYLLLSGLAAYIDDAGQYGQSEKFHIKSTVVRLNRVP